MSGGGGTAAEPRPFVRAVRKIKCAAMVASLAKSWQGWAADHSDKQETIPSGWMPVCVEDAEVEKTPVKLTVTPRVIAADAAGESKIRTGSVTKSIQLRVNKPGGGDLVNALRGKMESAPEDNSNSAKPFLGNESPTRRRQMRALQLAVGGSGGIQDRKSALQDKTLLGSRSSSLDTEDSGLGEEAGLSDGGESKNDSDAGVKKDRPKIQVSAMSDIKSRWQQWSKQHVEGQKLNPFSEDFDADLAMSQRLRKGDEGYGRPKEGTRTAERGDRAHKHVHKEMEEMCWIIREMGLQDRQGRTVISFGRLFDRYVKISDKVVGILLRCRKHKMVDFEGEMLWKGQDDDVIITLRD